MFYLLFLHLLFHNAHFTMFICILIVNWCILTYKCPFNRYTTGLVPRSVYTSGKSSSAAGLTATVAKEPETGEFCIEVFVFGNSYSTSFQLVISNLIWISKVKLQLCAMVSMTCWENEYTGTLALWKVIMDLVGSYYVISSYY